MACTGERHHSGGGTGTGPGTSEVGGFPKPTEVSDLMKYLGTYLPT
jgi:hypothetical protein